VGSGRARGDHAFVRRLDAISDGNLGRCLIGYQHGDEERRNPSRTLVQKDRVVLLNGLKPPQTAAHEHANPLGIPIMQVPMIPDYLPVSYPGSAGPGTAIGAAYGPFDVIAGQNDAVKLTVVDSGGTHSITEFTLTPGTLHASEIANQINAQFVANSALAVAKDNGDGRLRLETTEGGAAYNIQVEATGTPSENFLLNTAIIATATYSGTAADGTVDEGSFIWLANPKNFVWGILQGTRIYTNFEEKTDTIENIVYNQVDAKVENIDAIVKCVNVRLTDLS